MIPLAFMLCLAGDWRPPELQVAPPPAVVDSEALLERALSYLGRPYVSGGVGSPGFDCSGFVCRVYAESGYALPRVSRDQARAGRLVAKSEIRPGDLLFFAEKGRRISHVGLYLGNGELVHASTGRGMVTVAKLSSAWFQERLVGVRRVLTSTPTEIAAPRVQELVEHAETFSLPRLFRRPQRRPPPDFGLALYGEGKTYLGVRAGGSLRGDTLGGVVIPEAGFLWQDYALAVAVQLPIYFDDSGASIGDFERWQDAFRFVRRISVGVEDADLEVSLQRGEDLSLGRGALVTTAVPHLGTRDAGTSLLSLTRDHDPLSLSGRFRSKAFSVEASIDDVVAPGLFGAAAQASLPVVPFQLNAAVATDQRAIYDANRRAIIGGELGLFLDSVDKRSISFDFGVVAATARTTSGFGGLVKAQADLQTRFGSRRSARVGLHFGGGVLSGHMLDGLFGPTYTAHRSEHYAALLTGSVRGLAEAGAEFGLGPLLLSGDYATGLGEGAAPLDTQFKAQLQLLPFSIGGPRLSVAANVALRAPSNSDERLMVATGALRLELSSWLDVEAYVARGQAWTGAMAVRVAYAP